MESMLAKVGGLTETHVEVPDPPLPASSYRTLLGVFGGIPDAGGAPVSHSSSTATPPSPTSTPPELSQLKLVKIDANPVTGEPAGAILLPAHIAEQNGW